VLFPPERQRVQTAKRTLRHALYLKYGAKDIVKANMIPDRLIAELPFGFWTYLLGSESPWHTTRGCRAPTQ
jgi:hypothetical protein